MRSLGSTFLVVAAVAALLWTTFQAQRAARDIEAAVSELQQFAEVLGAGRESAPTPSATAPASPGSENPPQAVRITRIVDGDTYDVGGTRYRLAGVDTPEIGGHALCWAERVLGEKATRRVEELTSSEVSIVTFGEPVRRDRDNRVLARVLINDVDLGELLVNEGLGAYGVTRFRWCGIPRR